MTFTPPTSPANPGRAYYDMPFQPLTTVPEPFRLALGMVAKDLLKMAAGFALVTGVGGLLLMSVVIGSHNLPAAIATVLVTCFGVGFAGYVITRARGFS